MDVQVSPAVACTVGACKLCPSLACMQAPAACVIRLSSARAAARAQHRWSLCAPPDVLAIHRWRAAARAVRMGINVFLTDSDIVVRGGMLGSRVLQVGPPLEACT